MGKKIKIRSLFKNSKEARSNPWQHWASCKHPKTQSFRGGEGDSMFKTVNSVFFDQHQVLVDGVETQDSWLTNSSSETASLSTDQSEDCCCCHHFDGKSSSLDMVVRGVMRSERLFFEPCGDSNSILEEAKKTNNGFLPFNKESVVVLGMESSDPYIDFRRSMEEMVESYGVNDWEGLDKLLGWYLKVNGKRNHGFIIGAFIDLLVGISSSSCSSSSSSSSCLDATSSSCSLQGKNEICEEEETMMS